MTYNDAVHVSKEGILIQIHVIPGSTHSVFPAGYNPWRHSLEIKVQAQAKENKANTEVREIISAFFQHPINDVSLVSGQKTREKTVYIQNISRVAILKKLEETFHGLQTNL